MITSQVESLDQVCERTQFVSRLPVGVQAVQPSAQGVQTVLWLHLAIFYEIIQSELAGLINLVLSSVDGYQVAVLEIAFQKVLSTLVIHLLGALDDFPSQYSVVRADYFVDFEGVVGLLEAQHLSVATQILH